MVLWTSVAVLWLLVIAEGVVILATLRSVASVHVALDQFVARRTPATGSVSVGPTVGTRIDNSEFYDITNDTVFQTENLWKQGALMIVLVSAQCSVCLDVLKVVAKAVSQDDHSNWRGCVLAQGGQQRIRAIIDDCGMPNSVPVALVDETRIQAEYSITHLPTVLIIGSDGRVVDVRVGRVDEQELMEMVAKRLAA